MRDWLTGLHNRRYMARELERFSRERRGGHYSVAVLDLDHFKAVNDACGHDAGDAVLARVAALLLHQVRAGDAVVRTGGEEFVILMPAAEAGAAVACCERLRAVIAAEPWDRIAVGLTVTTSVGVATSPDATELDARQARRRPALRRQARGPRPRRRHRLSGARRPRVYAPVDAPRRDLAMNDIDVQNHIEQLVAEEHRLLSHGGEQGLSERDHERLARLRVELDRYWDLLRQRRAREEYGEDPDSASLRDADTVEGYEG